MSDCWQVVIKVFTKKNNTTIQQHNNTIKNEQEEICTEIKDKKRRHCNGDFR